ncbi:MAG TPA: DUF4043 family protein [Prosthecobacter sp.]|nr:DUF4043 family protein [Prosthecobacter sp.]
MPANPAYSSPSYTESPITGDRLKAISPDAVRKLWKRGVEVFEQTSDFFAEMEGNSPLSIIQTETDLSKGAGQEITFTKKSGLYGEAHLGEERFHDSRHYEELLIGTDKLSVDWFRHGVEYTERSEELMGMRGELVQGLPDELGKWGGRLKTEKMFMLFREQTPGENRITLSGTLNWNSIVTNAQMMKRWGAPSAMVGRDPSGKALRRYCIVACTDALTSLKLDSDYRDALKSTTSGMHNRFFFSGGFTDVDGHVIKEYEAIEHDGYGAIGSPLNPMARLGAALTITSTSYTAPVYITGGGSDYDANNILVKTTKYFPGYAYKVQAGVTLTPSTDDFYVAIINPPNAAVDPNKYGLYRIGNGQTTPLTINDGNKLAIEAALVDGTTVAAHAVGTGPALVTSLGSVAWDANKHSNTHPVDALVVLVHADASAKFCSLILGAASARRGYGKYRNNRTFQNKEGNFVRDVFFNTVMGQSLRTNRRGRAPGVLALWHKGIYAGTPLPTP